MYHALGRNEGIAVDTHVRRLAQRIGFSDTDNVEIIERDLMKVFPRDLWGDLTDVLIAHGRATCDAKKPLCGECVISGMCRWYRTEYSP
jgi:endonuclease-3